MLRLAALFAAELLPLALAWLDRDAASTPSATSGFAQRSSPALPPLDRLYTGLSLAGLPVRVAWPPLVISNLTAAATQTVYYSNQELML